MRIKYQILVGGLVTFKIWNQIDRDKNRTISPVEKSAFTSSIASTTTTTLDDIPIPFNLISSTLPTYEDLITGNSPTLDFEFEVPIPQEITGNHSLRITSVGFPGYSYVITKPVFGSDTGAPIVDSSSSINRSAIFRFHGRNTSPGSVLNPRKVPDTKNALIREQYSSNFRQLLPSYGSRGINLFAALGVAFILGAAHALTPGHGKALVGAYLVAERGTVKDAIKLGLITTGAHVGSVYLFGFAVLGVSHYFSERALGAWMGIVSGLLVLSAGCFLLLRGLLRWYGLNVDHHHTHSHDNDHSDETSQSGPNEEVHDHHHGHAFPNTHSHSGSLWSIGIAGGLAPCPDAIAVLAAAIQLGNIMMGIALITAFSAGLGAVLVTIGIIMVKAGSKLNNWSDNSKVMKLIPILGASAVLALGLSLLNQTLIQLGILNWHALTH